MKIDVRVIDTAGTPRSGAIVLVNVFDAKDWAKPGVTLNPNPRVTGPDGSVNFYDGPPVDLMVGASTLNFNGYTAPAQTNNADLLITVVASFKHAFQPAPRIWKANMCGVRVAGLPAVPGGAADPSLVLSWFIDRYMPEDRQRIYQAWKDRGLTHVLISWPDSRSFGQSPEQFKATCQELIAYGFYPCPFLSSKDMDPPDVPGILANIAPVLPLLLGLVPMACIGWELSLWLSPTQVQELIDALAPSFVQERAHVYVHFQEDYFAFPQPDHDSASFWNLQIGKLTGLLHQRKLSNDRDLYRARLVDCLQRVVGGFNMPADSGFGHPFDVVALEITAQLQFNGEMIEADGDSWGQWAIETPACTGPTGVVASIMGSGNGEN